MVVLKFEDFYTLGSLLGKGTFSEVKVAKHKQTKKDYAVKLIKKDQLDED